MSKDISIVIEKSAFDNFETRYALQNVTNSDYGAIVTRSRSAALKSGVAMKRRGKLEEFVSKAKSNPTSEYYRTSPAHDADKEESSGSVDVNNSKERGPKVEPRNAADVVQYGLLEKYKKLEEVLGAKFVNVVDRLKLDFIPYCVQNMMHCKTHHSKKCPRPNVVDRYQNSKAKHLVDEERTLQFLKFVEDMCLRTEFPGACILGHLWELILTVNHKDNKMHSSEQVIRESVLVFENTLFTFPPCWYDIRESYQKLLTDNFNLRKVLPSVNTSNQTILQFVLSMMGKVMMEENTEEQGRLPADVSDDFFNFQEWEARNAIKQNFEVLSRTDKLDRLFLVLHLIVKILELDLSIWMLRYVSKPNKHIYDEKGPLVSQLLRLSLYHQISAPVREVLKIFINCVCFSYPQAQINIVSRLISLISVTINLCENPEVQGKIKYPNIGPITEAFAKEIFKAVDNCVGRNVSHYLSVIEHIKTPFIKYLIIDQLLYKMNPDPGQMCVKKIFDNFRNKRWLQCSDQLLNGEPSEPTAKSTCKYPVIPKTFTKPRVSDIYRDQYLNILLEALRAYCDVYAIKEVANLFSPTKGSSNGQQGSAVKSAKKIPKNKKLNLNHIERDIAKLTANLNVHQKCINTELQLPLVEGMYVDETVMSFYKTELKYLSMFPKNIFALREKYGTVLDKWYQFTQNELFSVNASA